jgi:glycosyltransferase involved in cell wall biosynthesis
LEFLSFLEKYPEYTLLFVNDGSTDNTLNILEDLKIQNDVGIQVLNNTENQGKANSVRNGMFHALIHCKSTYLAFLDADLATPLNEIIQMVSVLNENEKFDVSFGSRIRRLGANIQRSGIRHYLGRIFVTYTNLMLKINVYDSQCGAKVFRNFTITPIFETPFISNWFFDIEVILRTDKNRIIEIPVSMWTEIKDSKLKMRDFVKAPFEILKIRKQYTKSKILS